jgi:hypothetical protein
VPRYMVERTFASGLAVPVNADGAGALLKIVSANGEQGVTWFTRTSAQTRPGPSASMTLLAEADTCDEEIGPIAYWFARDGSRWARLQGASMMVELAVPTLPHGGLCSRSSPKTRFSSRGKPPCASAAL